MKDTGDIAHVEEHKRLDTDELGLGSNALDGGPDDEGLDEIYLDPGEVVEDELG